MKLKDYEIPQYGLADAPAQEDLEQYSLKNFDLKAFQLTQQYPPPEPIPAPCDPFPLQQQTAIPSPVAAAPQAPSPGPLDVDLWSSPAAQPNEPSFSHAPDPVQADLYQPPPAPCDVQFGAHFNLQTVSYTALSPAQSWKIPRWVVAMVGLFFGSAAVLTLAFCIVLLRDPKPAPTAALAVPAVPVATAPAATAAAATAPPSASAPTTATAHLADRAAPATPRLMRNDSPPARRVVVSRHPSFVRRQVYRPRHVASNGASSSAAPQETETASRQPPKDALDQLLSESTL